MNAAIELHDSKVTAIALDAHAVVIRLSAFVHRSDGRPGVDPGQGWSQHVEFVFASGVVVERPEELPCTLDNGNVSGGAEFRGLVPLPASIGSAVRFEAHGLYGERLVIQGVGLEVFAVTEGAFVESFPGTKPI